MVLLDALCELASSLRLEFSLSLASPGADFNRAVGVAHIVTCLSRAFAEPRPLPVPFFPSLMLSAESPRGLHGADLLVRKTFNHLSARLVPAEPLDLDSADVEVVVHATAPPALLAVPGLHRSWRPRGGGGGGVLALEYTHGVVDM